VIHLIPVLYVCAMTSVCVYSADCLNVRKQLIYITVIYCCLMLVAFFGVVCEVSA